MTPPSRVRPVLALAAVVSLAALVACSGGSDDDAAVPAGETWCEIVAVSNSLDDRFDEVDSADAGALRSIVPRIGELGPRFRAAAPDEIATEVDAYAEANSRLAGVFEAADYDITAVDNGEITAIIDGVAEESTVIDVYTFAACGDYLGPDNR